MYMGASGQRTAKKRSYPYAATIGKLRQQLAQQKKLTNKHKKKVEELTLRIPIAGRDNDELYEERKQRFIKLLCNRRPQLFHRVLRHLVANTPFVYRVRDVRKFHNPGSCRNPSSP